MKRENRARAIKQKAKIEYGTEIATLNNRYQLFGKIGDGASSMVYSAYDKTTDAWVVVKVLSNDRQSRSSHHNEV